MRSFGTALPLRLLANLRIDNVLSIACQVILGALPPIPPNRRERDSARLSTVPLQFWSDVDGSDTIRLQTGARLREAKAGGPCSFMT
jgi:hypothetical protein